MSAPEPPRDVRIVYRNGVVVECPVKYIGFRGVPDESDTPRHGWRVLNEGPFDYREGDELQVGSPPMGGYYIEVVGTGPKAGDA